MQHPTQIHENINNNYPRNNIGDGIAATIGSSSSIIKMKKTYTTITKPKDFLAKTPKAKGVTLAKDSKGYFVYTHRWASKRFNDRFDPKENNRIL